MPEKEKQNLLYKLQLHQLRLEQQYKELEQAKTEIEKSRRKYSDLFDFAPIGYLTLNEKGIISEANLAIAKKLGFERNRLIGASLKNHVKKVDRNLFDAHLKQVFAEKTPLTSELRIEGKTGCFFMRNSPACPLKTRPVDSLAE